MNWSGPRKYLCKVLVVAVFVILALLSWYLYTKINKPLVDDLKDEVTSPLPPSASKLIQMRKAMAVTNGQLCAKMAANILQKNGSAVDAAITALLCDGISCPQSMGIGGGFLMTVYIKKEGKAYAINAREKAPAAASIQMYHGRSQEAQIGPRAAGIPAEILGYWTAYNRFGGALPWKDLFVEPIGLAREGIPINFHLGKNIKLYEKYIRASPQLSALFINEKNQTKVEGDSFTWPKLADTLEVIANEGGLALHNGSLTEAFVKDIQNAGGLITEEDMNNMEVIVEEPLKAKLVGDDTLWTTPLPGSGILLSFMLQVLQYLIPNVPSELLWHQRFTEVMKYAYAYRGYLGDNDPSINNSYTPSINKVLEKLQSPDFIQEVRSKVSDTKTWQNLEHYSGEFFQAEDHGTANIVVLSEAGDAVVATSTVNLVFGSKFVSPSTGIILNDEMDDFSSPNITNYFNIPPSPANLIQSGKRPLSSMCPSIITDSQGDVKLALGAAGGTKITTSVAQVIMLNLWGSQTLKQAMDAPRIHHQLYPMKYGYEYGVLKSIVEGMRNIGHVTMRLPSVFTSSVTAISTFNTGGNVTGNADFRRTGAADGY